MKKIYNIKITTIIMVLLPILSILIGYFGVKLYLLSNNNFNDEIDNNRPGVEEIVENDDAKTDELSSDVSDSNADQSNDEIDSSEKKVTNSINGINYYSIQVGSFSNEENAVEFRDSFISKGHFSYYIENGNYKVFVAASYNKESLDEALEAIKTTSPDAFIKNIDLESKNYSYVINDTDYFESISELIATQLNGINASISINKVNDALEALEKKNNQFVQVNEINKNIGDQVTNYINGVKNEVNALDTGDEKSVKKFLEKNIGLFIKYFR